MIKPLAVVLVATLAVPAAAQTAGEMVISQYAEFMKSRAAARSCLSEEGRMQVERNERYSALLRANAKNPAAPTIAEMSDAQAQVRLEDEALVQKRDECSPLLDVLVAAARELSRDCYAYVAPSTDDQPRPTGDALAVDICHGPAKNRTADKAVKP